MTLPCVLPTYQLREEKGFGYNMGMEKRRKYIEARRDWWEIIEELTRCRKKLNRLKKEYDNEKNRQKSEEAKILTDVSLTLDEIWKFIDLLAKKMLEVRADD